MKNVRRHATITVGELATALSVELCTPREAAAGSPDLPGDVSLPIPLSPEPALALILLRSRLLDRASGIADADSTSLVFAEDAATFAQALASSAGAILLHPRLLSPAAPPQTGAALLLASNPRLCFARAAQLLRAPEAGRGIHEKAYIAPGAQLGARAIVGAFAVVEAGVTVGAGSEIGAGAVLGTGVQIGCDCRIYPKAVLYPGTRLGDRVVVHAGAVLGADGFGYVRDEATGAYHKFPQQGTLVIGDDVEIGANTTIDRGALESTRIARGVKLDNLVHVGHNVEVGEDVVIAAQTGISGSSVIGRGAVIAGQVGIADHVSVGEDVVLGAQSGVPSRKRVRGKGVLFWGTPARPIQQYLKELATLARLARAPRSPHAGGDGAEET